MRAIGAPLQFKVDVNIEQVVFGRDLGGSNSVRATFVLWLTG